MLRVLNKSVFYHLKAFLWEVEGKTNFTGLQKMPTFLLRPEYYRLCKKLVAE